MAQCKSKSARQVAFYVLDRFNPALANTRQILHGLLDRTDQRSQATDLVFGVIRNRSVIDLVISKLSNVPKERFTKKVLNILRIGAYELIFAPQTAEYAIVNEAVELAKSIASDRQAGFVNAVLRNIQRAIDVRTMPMTGTDPRKTLPQSALNGCVFKDVILPDLEESCASYLSSAFSLPEWLIADWLDEFGFEKTRAICFASNRRPGLYLRANALKITPEALAEQIEAGGAEYARCAEGMIRLKSARGVADIAGFREGLFTVQDTTAAKVVTFLAPKPKETIVDLCAAPGGKTTQMAELMANTGTIIATDIDPERLHKVDENCKRLGITIVKTVPYADLQQTICQLPRIDAVLLDVPCSNTGVLARRCEVRFRVTPQALKGLAKIQSGLLEKAAQILTPGAKICYSTCSIAPQENSFVIEQFLKTHTDFKLNSRQFTPPSVLPDESFDCDGGFVAILQKE